MANERKTLLTVEGRMYLIPDGTDGTALARQLLKLKSVRYHGDDKYLLSKEPVSVSIQWAAEPLVDEDGKEYDHSGEPLKEPAVPQEDK